MRARRFLVALNISSAPNVPETTSEYTNDQISIFGAALSIGIDTKGYRLTLGATGYFGRGDALAFEIDNDANLVALAELWFGAGRERSDFAVVTIEHGVRVADDLPEAVAAISG